MLQHSKVRLNVEHTNVRMYMYIRTYYDIMIIPVSWLSLFNLINGVLPTVSLNPSLIHCTTKITYLNLKYIPVI